MNERSPVNQPSVDNFLCLILYTQTMPEGGPTNVGKYERIMVALMRGKLEVVLGLTWAKEQEGKAIESGENVFRGLKYIQKELRVLDEIQSLKTLEDVRTFCQRKELNFEEILEEVRTLEALPRYFIPPKFFRQGLKSPHFL